MSKEEPFYKQAIQVGSFCRTRGNWYAKVVSIWKGRGRWPTQLYVMHHPGTRYETPPIIYDQYGQPGWPTAHTSAQGFDISYSRSLSSADLMEIVAAPTVEEIEEWARLHWDFLDDKIRPRRKGENSEFRVALQIALTKLLEDRGIPLDHKGVIESLLMRTMEDYLKKHERRDETRLPEGYGGEGPWN